MRITLRTAPVKALRELVMPHSPIASPWQALHGRLTGASHLHRQPPQRPPQQPLQRTIQLEDSKVFAFLRMTLAKGIRIEKGERLDGAIGLDAAPSLTSPSVLHGVAKNCWAQLMKMGEGHQLTFHMHSA